MVHLAIATDVTNSSSSAADLAPPNPFTITESDAGFRHRYSPSSKNSRTAFGPVVYSVVAVFSPDGSESKSIRSGPALSPALVVTAALLRLESVPAQGGEPGAPQPVAAAPEGAPGLRATWSEPASTGSGPILGYIVQAVPIAEPDTRCATGVVYQPPIVNDPNCLRFGGSTQYVDASQRTALLSVFSTVPYRVRVWAYNAGGLGQRATAPNTVSPFPNDGVPEVVPSPQGVSAFEVQRGSVLVNWQPPSRSGVAIQGYQLSWRNAPAVSVPAGVNSFTVSGLTIPSVALVFEVRTQVGGVLSPEHHRHRWCWVASPAAPVAPSSSRHRRQPPFPRPRRRPPPLLRPLPSRLPRQPGRCPQLYRRPQRKASRRRQW
jgi:Fibronectin type III domain